MEPDRDRRPAHTAMLGDKLLTDMLAARRAGVTALMVEPLGGPVGAVEPRSAPAAAALQGGLPLQIPKKSGQKHKLNGKILAIPDRMG